MLHLMHCLGAGCEEQEVALAWAAGVTRWGSRTATATDGLHRCWINNSFIKYIRLSRLCKDNPMEMFDIGFWKLVSFIV